VNNLKLAVVCILLFLLSVFSRELSNPAPLSIESSYQTQYQELNKKGYLTEDDMKHLDNLKGQYLNSSERNDKMLVSMGYKLLLGVIMAVITFIGLRTTHVNSLAIVSVSLVVGLSSFFVTSVLEATYYFLLTLSGAILAKKHNKQIHPTPNNGAAD
jgi:hypothetical protein